MENKNNTTILDEEMVSLMKTVMAEQIERAQQVATVRWVYSWLVPCMWLVLSLAVIGNALIYFSSYYLNKRIAPNLRLCISLAAADTWAALLMIIGLLLNSYLPVVVGVGLREGSFSCMRLALELIRIAAMLTSDVHLFVLALNHMFGVLSPLKHRVFVTTSRLRQIIALMWLVPPLGLFVVFNSFPNEGFFQAGCPQQFYVRFPFRLGLFIVFIIPLLAAVTIYILILYNLFKTKEKLDQGFELRKLSHLSNRLNKKSKAIYTTMLIVGSFVVSWGTCLVYFVLLCRQGCALIHGKSISLVTGTMIACVVNFLVMSKLAANPLIYALRIGQIRWALLRMLSTWLFCVSKEGADKIMRRQSSTNFSIFDNSIGLIFRYSVPSQGLSCNNISFNNQQHPLNLHSNYNRSTSLATNPGLVNSSVASSRRGSQLSPSPSTHTPHRQLKTQAPRSESLFVPRPFIHNDEHSTHSISLFDGLTNRDNQRLLYRCRSTSPPQSTVDRL